LPYWGRPNSRVTRGHSVVVVRYKLSIGLKHWIILGFVRLNECRRRDKKIQAPSRIGKANSRHARWVRWSTLTALTTDALNIYRENPYPAPVEAPGKVALPRLNVIAAYGKRNKTKACERKVEGLKQDQQLG
jgi:hypothetical protein